MHVGSEAVKAHVATRMHPAPVFTRKLALMPFDLANSVCIHDDGIDLDHHVRYMVLAKPGSLAHLEAIAARLHSMFDQICFGLSRPAPAPAKPPKARPASVAR